MSGLMFGLIIGYLSWYAFKPGDSPETVPIEKIGALLAVISGATVLTLFPAVTELFETYSIGLGLGFFFTPGKKIFIRIREYLTEKINQLKQTRERKTRTQLSRVNEDWYRIESLISHKLKTSAKVDERSPGSKFIDSLDLQELSFSKNVVEHAMRRYAKENVQDGIEYKEWDGRPVLLKQKW